MIRPNLALVHEVGHAYHDVVNHALYVRLVNSEPFKWAVPPLGWKNEEEFRTIVKDEWPAATRLGQPRRNGEGSHITHGVAGMCPVWVSCPTCTE